MCDWILENPPNCHTRPFRFIGLANSYTHTLPIHSTITRLGWLVSFSGVSFADHVNSHLRKWDPWSALHGRHGSEIHLSESETSLKPSKHVWTYGWHFLGLIASPNTPNRSFNPSPAMHPPTPPTSPLPYHPSHLPIPYNVPSMILK